MRTQTVEDTKDQQYLRTFTSSLMNYLFHYFFSINAELCRNIIAVSLHYLYLHVSTSRCRHGLCAGDGGEADWHRFCADSQETQLVQLRISSHLIRE